MKLYKLLLVSAFCITALLFSGLFVYAEDSESIEDLQEQIEKYEKKVTDLQNQVSSLANEISSFDTQIDLTQLKIQSTTAKISQKENDITKLSEDILGLKDRIAKLEESISFQQNVLNQRIRERYKSRETSALVVFFGSSTFNNLVHKTEYLQVLEAQDNRLIQDMRNTKEAYDQQKTLFEQKKTEAEDLKADLEDEKANLDYYNNQLQDQKNQKEKLLEVTQNDESKYQELLEDARRELTQITGAVSALIGQDGEEVNQGEVIGYQGNSGFSSGEHLHFGVYRYSSFEEIDGWNWYYSNYVDPAKKLKNKSVYWNDGCSSSGNKNTGSGSWSWPISNPTISQGFGYTCWSNIYYGGNPHPALDMYGSAGTPVYAVEDGTAYFCRNCLGDGGNGVFIFHDDNYMTLYWHLR